jgi:hypothetical protein
MIKNPVTIPLTRQQRDDRLRRKTIQLRYGRLLTVAYEAGLLTEMLAWWRENKQLIM